MMSWLRCLKRKLVYGSWRKRHRIAPDGYTIILAAPMDMPFLLQLAFETLNSAKTDRCREILVVPDGSLRDNGVRLKSIIKSACDARIRYTEPGLRWGFLMSHVHNHPAMMALATESATCRYAFVHDLDAFLLEPDIIESMYDEVLEREMVAMGVSARWDPGFERLQMTIPGTWELFYDTCWIQKWPRQMMFGRKEMTSIGEIEFDSMLYPQYLDYGSGKVGISRRSHKIVHFNGTIRTYRMSQKKSARRINDDLFRLLLLSLLETVTVPNNEQCVCPSVSTLALGLTDPSAKVQYLSDVNRNGYGEFRRMIERMCDALVFAGSRCAKIRELIQQFDQHFAYNADERHDSALSAGDVRRSGISERRDS